MEQPNASGDGEAPLTPMFWLALVLTGVATGLLGAALMAVLFHVQHAAFGYGSGDLESGVRDASALRRVTSLLCAGVFGGIAWYLLRRFTPGQRSEVDDVLWSRSARLSVRRSLGSSVISVIVIGMGASLGREAAPKLMGGVSGGLFGRRLGLSAAQQRLLIACGGGAGLACVYNVPLGGGGLGFLLVLALLKPAVTALCLASGVSGGLFTPVLSTGAVLGGGLGLLWSHLWPGTPVGAYAMVGAAAMTGCAMPARSSAWPWCWS